MIQYTIASKSSKIINVSLGQKIAIGTYGGGIAKIFIETALGNIPPAYYLLRTIQNQQILLGEYERSQNIRIDAGDSDVLYKIGSDPVIETDIVSSSTSGNANKLINGNFDIWQRGTSFADVTTGVYTADRWLANTSGATVTYSQQAFTPGQTNVPGEPAYFLRCNATVADDGWGIVQPIEDVRTLAGSDFTLSFNAKADAALAMRILIRQDFGSGGSSDVDLTYDDFTMTAGWKKYIFTSSIDSIAGKTIGTDHSLRVFILINENTDGTLDLSKIKMEPDSIATPFDQPLLAAELALCQRYCWQGKSVANGNAHLYAGGAETVMYCSGASFPVTMRKTPTMSIVTNPTYNNCSAFDLSASENGFCERVNVTGAGKYRAYNGVYRADAEI